MKDYNIKEKLTGDPITYRNFFRKISKYELDRK